MQLRERAVADLAKIDATIARLDEQLRRARDDRVKLQHFLEVADRYARGQDDEQDKAPPAGRRSSKAGRLRELAHAFLGQFRAPVPIGEIAQHVVDQGEDIPGVDKGSYLSSVLARDERFHNIRNAGWLLAGAPWATREFEAGPEAEPTREQEMDRAGADYGPEPDEANARRIADDLDDDIEF